MLTLKRENPFVKKVKSISFLLFNKLENNNNAEFETNGEKKFLENLLSVVSNGVTIFDIGANMGKYSEIVIDRCNSNSLRYDLHIFEPSKKAFKILESKFSNNDKVHLCNFGASDLDRDAAIFFDEEGSSFTSLYDRKDSLGQLWLDKTDVIQLKRLDNYITRKSIEKIDLLKLDVEGHELSAFKGLGEFLMPSFIRAIQFEYGGTNLDSKTSLYELYSLLEQKGYVLFKLMKNHIEKRRYSLKMENYQYSNYVALAEDLVNDRN